MWDELLFEGMCVCACGCTVPVEHPDILDHFSGLWVADKMGHVEAMGDDLALRIDSVANLIKRITAAIAK